MHFAKSIEFFQYKEQTVIINFEIQSIKYSNFKHAFTTDKYINICEWESISSKIYNIIDDILKEKCSWKGKSDQFKIHDLMVRYKVVNKKEGLIDYEKIKYSLDWIINITIIRKESNSSESYSLTEKSSSSKSIVSINDDASQNNENAIIVDDDSSDIIHESKKMKFNQDGERENYNNTCPLGQNNQYNEKFRKKDDKSKQGNLNNWISTTKPITKTTEEKKLFKLKESKSSKERQKASTSKEAKPTTSKDVVKELSKEDLEQMKNFVARSKEEELKKENRKKKLEGYEILNCCSMKNEEIVRILNFLKTNILDHFEKQPLNFFEGEIKPCEITASNILNQKQVMFVLNEIEKLRPEDERGTKEEILHDVVLPYVIIEIFKENYELSTRHAIKRIKKQDEKKMLFKEDGFNESY